MGGRTDSRQTGRVSSQRIDELTPYHPFRSRDCSIEVKDISLTDYIQVSTRTGTLVEQDELESES
jgi:hypothetical protein